MSETVLGTSQAKIRIGFVSVARFARETLLQAFALESDFLPIDLGSGGPESVEWARNADPDLVLIDLPPVDAGFLSEALLEAVAGTRPVVVHRGLAPGHLVPLAEAGCVGFVSTDCGYRDLIRELRSILREESNCPPQLAGALIRSMHNRHPHSSQSGESPPVLSPREREVAALLEQHHSNKEIAAKLGIECGTVKNHVHSVLTKLGIRKRWEVLLRRTGEPKSGSPE
jgi:two-component system, NarL family, nitrate/nitrite response regulator NarL